MTDPHALAVTFHVDEGGPTPAHVTVLMAPTSFEALVVRALRDSDPLDGPDWFHFTTRAGVNVLIPIDRVRRITTDPLDADQLPDGAQLATAAL